MAQSDLTRVIEPACQKLAQQFGFELVDVELAREGASRYLRIYIDKPDGITLSDCETYHRAVAPLVERVDYDFLEVCSPGLDRPLKKQKEVSLCKPLVIITEDDIAMDEEMSDDEKNDSEGR